MRQNKRKKNNINQDEDNTNKRNRRITKSRKRKERKEMIIRRTDNDNQQKQKKGQKKQKKTTQKITIAFKQNAYTDRNFHSAKLCETARSMVERRAAERGNCLKSPIQSSDGSNKGKCLREAWHRDFLFPFLSVPSFHSFIIMRHFFLLFFICRCCHVVVVVCLALIQGSF